MATPPTDDAQSRRSQPVGIAKGAPDSLMRCLARLHSAEGYRAMPREAGQAVTSFDVRRQFKLIVRLDPDGEDEVLARPHARPMDLTGRRMRGFITVRSGGLKGDRLNRWVQEAVARAESLPPK